MFIIISKYLKSLEEVDSKRSDHLAYMNNYVLAGTFLLGGRQVPTTGAAIVAHNITREELEEILRNDPYVINGLAEYNIIEFNVGMSALGIEEAIEKLK